MDKETICNRILVLLEKIGKGQNHTEIIKGLTSNWVSEQKSLLYIDCHSSIVFVGNM